MSITSSGPLCDVCGDYILFGSTNPFSCKGIDRTLHSHDECKPKIEEADGKWKNLPDGPLRKAFERAMRTTNIGESMNTYGFSGWFYVRASDFEAAVEKAKQATKSTEDVVFGSPTIQMETPGDTFFEQKKKEIEW